ncbi:YdhK family protein [Corynebacterium sp. H130]|uniref:YdhK family protein n=1 Tax=Corynebacterium sp. H130 TaxID=3133444 RepID=UPI0030AB8C14
MTRRALATVAIAALTLAGCANSQKDSDLKVDTATSAVVKAPAASHEHNHAMDGGAAPANMKVAANPAFPVGTEVVLKADHMDGMMGATAKIVGAYDTTAYAVSYTPTTGGAEVKNHKWVVFEELKPHADAATAELNADHMPGMKGADATIDSETTETVYMVDVTSGPMQMKNHKWFVESELAAK